MSVDRATLATDHTLMFHCPGCKCAHGVTVNRPGSWGWNGSLEMPTITPSILVRSTEMTEAGWLQYEAWKRDEIGCPQGFDSRPTICHSFVTDGRIQYLDDCTHNLTAQTVDIPEWDSE